MIFPKGKVGKHRADDDADLGADHLGEADRALNKSPQAQEQPAADPRLIFLERAAGRARSHRGRHPISSDDATRSDPLVITLEARGSEKFDVLFDGKVIVQASSQPISEAARALHDLGYPGELLLVARHQGANHDALRGRLGVWRRLRVREDRGGPRFARWEPLPRRVGAKQGRTEGKAIGHRAGEKDAPTAAPGAAKRHSLPPVGQNSAISDSEGRSDA